MPLAIWAALLRVLLVSGNRTNPDACCLSLLTEDGERFWPLSMPP